jgi:hypothetical protein
MRYFYVIIVRRTREIEVNAVVRIVSVWWLTHPQSTSDQVYQNEHGIKFIHKLSGLGSDCNKNIKITKVEVPCVYEICTDHRPQRSESKFGLIRNQ